MEIETHERVMFDPAKRRFMRRPLEDAFIALPWAFGIGNKHCAIVTMPFGDSIATTTVER